MECFCFFWNLWSCELYFSFVTVIFSCLELFSVLQALHMLPSYFQTTRLSIQKSKTWTAPEFKVSASLPQAGHPTLGSRDRRQANPRHTVNSVWNSSHLFAVCKPILCLDLGSQVLCTCKYPHLYHLCFQAVLGKGSQPGVVFLSFQVQ